MIGALVLALLTTEGQLSDGCDGGPCPFNLPRWGSSVAVSEAIWPKLWPFGTHLGTEPHHREQEIELVFDRFRFTRVVVSHEEDGLVSVSYLHAYPPKEKEQELFEALDAALTRIFGAPTQKDPCRTVWRRSDAFVTHSSVGLQFEEPYARNDRDRMSFCTLPVTPSRSAAATSWTGLLPGALATNRAFLSVYEPCLRPALSKVCGKGALRRLDVFVALEERASVTLYGPRLSEPERATMASCIRDAIEKARGEVSLGGGFWDARYTDCRGSWN